MHTFLCLLSAGLKRQQAELQAVWEAERDEMGRVQQLKGEIDRVGIEIQVRAYGAAHCAACAALLIVLLKAPVH